MPKIDDAEVFRHLGNTLADDLLREDAEDEEIAEILRAAGGDPAAIGRNGRAQVARIFDARRLSWMHIADQKRRRFEVADGDDSDIDRMTEEELLVELRWRQTRSDAGEAIRAAFSKRRAVKSDRQELQGMLRQARRLERLSSHVPHRAVDAAPRGRDRPADGPAHGACAVTCRCVRRSGVTVTRDSSCWDALTGRCGRCGRLYREVERAVRVGGSPPTAPTAPTLPNPCDPSDPNDPAEY